MKPLFITFFIVLTGVSGVFADIVILKDGTAIECDKTWEDGHIIFCETEKTVYELHKNSVESIVKVSGKRETKPLNEDEGLVRQYLNRVKAFFGEFRLPSFNFNRIHIIYIITAIVAFVVLNTLRKKVKQAKMMRGSVRKARKSLKALDPAEMAILREFFIQKQDAIDLPINKPAVSRLLRKGILQIEYQDTEYSVGAVAPVTIRSAVKKYITPKIIGMPDVEDSDGQIEFIVEPRSDIYEQ